MAVNESEQPGDAVTVVIPTADRPDLLRRAVASVREQTEVPASTLIVDNGIEPAAMDPAWPGYVELVRVDPRIGPARARNIGTARAATAWVAFLDDDDYWAPDYLALCLARRDAAGAADVVLGRLDREGSGGVSRPYKCFPAKPADMRAVYYRNPGFVGSNLLVRRSLLLDLGGFAETMWSSEDRDLAARLLEYGARIVVAPEAVVISGEHDGIRAHSQQVRGNGQFLRRRWRYMRIGELARAGKTLLGRWLRQQRAG